MRPSSERRRRRDGRRAEPSCEVATSPPRDREERRHVGKRRVGRGGPLRGTRTHTPMPQANRGRRNGAHACARARFLSLYPSPMPVSLLSSSRARVPRWDRPGSTGRPPRSGLESDEGCLPKTRAAPRGCSSRTRCEPSPVAFSGCRHLLAGLRPTVASRRRRRAPERLNFERVRRMSFFSLRASLRLLPSSTTGAVHPDRPPPTSPALVRSWHGHARSRTYTHHCTR